MSALSIIVTRRLPEAVERGLSSTLGARLNADDHQFSPTELLESLRSYDVVLCTLTDRLTADLLRATGLRVRMLANFGVGTNHIDLAAARDAGLIVSNTPGVLTEDTADLTLLLMLGVARRAKEGADEVALSTWTGWRPTHLLGSSVHGATLGIVGPGRIGQAVARRAGHGFGMRVLCASRTPLDESLERELAIERASSLEKLLEESDFVSIHCPATPATRHLIGPAQLARMKRTAFLINAARGDIVDETALVHALDRGIIADAGLDVFEFEPAVPDALHAHPRVFALPHLGSATIESREAMGFLALRNVDAFFRGEEPPNRVG